MCRRCYSALQSESNTVTKMSPKLRKIAANVKQMATNALLVLARRRMVYLLDRSDFELGRDFCAAQQLAYCDLSILAISL